MAQHHSTPMNREISSSRSFSLHTKDDLNNFLIAQSTVSVAAETFLRSAGLQTLWDTPDWVEMVGQIIVDQTQERLKKAWDGITNETDQYKSFCDWVQHLVPFITRLPREPARKIRFVPSNDKNLACGPGYLNGKEVDGTATKFQPAVVCMADGVTELNKWSQVLVPMEFKKGTSSSATIASGNVTPAFPISGSQVLLHPINLPSSQSRDHLKRSREGGDESLPQGKKTKTSGPHRFPSVATPTPTPNRYTPTRADIRLARYAMETFAAVGDRTHVFAMLVARPDVTFWYFDRCGAVCTSALNINQSNNFVVFLKFLSALVYMNDDLLGFNPFFTNSSSTAPAGTREKLFGLTVTIPDSGGATLRLQEVLDRRTGLVGRATLVCKAELKENGGEAGQVQEVVIKSSWQHSTYTPEWNILHQLHQNNQARDHIVWCFHGWEQTGATVSSQRAKFGEPMPSVVDDRALRHTVLEYLKPITELSQPFHIPSIAWNIMQAIKFLNENEWFHRDISIGNMGFSLRPECGGAVIKLHDFDLSMHHTSNSATSHWTGTVPFMSIELLSQTSAPHMIGFEVEALTWTILWIVLVYTNGEDKNPVADHPLKGWFSNTRTLKEIAETKAMHLTKSIGLTNDFYKDLNRELRGLVKEWRQMREDQVNERDKQNCDTLISEHVYGMPCFDTIQEWMKKQRWDEPRKACTCGKHCLLK
ncbi:hypothetical protein FRC01_000589 [Tulasnella sp. 417]|nr:hypothetical protein FRC01_000589 [Tulasnella sp. 417]